MVAGSRFNDTHDSDHLDRDIVVAKVAGGDGTVRWQTTIDGTSARADDDRPSDDSPREDEALALGIDTAGNVIAGGYVFTRWSNAASVQLTSYAGATPPACTS